MSNFDLSEAVLPLACTTQAAPATYWVSADGSDSNDGFSVETAFRRLSTAVSQASHPNSIKTITVLGTLNEETEGENSSDFVFSLLSTLDKTTPILITGVPNAPAGYRAILSAADSGKNCVRTVDGVFRFEHIDITGSCKRGLTVDCDVTLGAGSIVNGNNGGGVIVSSPRDRDKYKSGYLTLDGGIVSGNERAGVGGGILVMGSFALIKGYVMENTAVPHSGELSAGGGLLVASNSSDTVSFYGGQVSGNKAYLGGGVAILSGSVVMSGGAIVDNTASLEDGLVLLGSQDEAVFIQQGGTVSRIGEFRHPEIWRRQ